MLPTDQYLFLRMNNFINLHMPVTFLRLGLLRLVIECPVADVQGDYSLIIVLETRLRHLQLHFLEGQT